MNISIIIPVYNAEKYLQEAVESAIAQPETEEIILIEDASTDDSLQVCIDLSEKNSKVKLFRHEDGKNHGAGASRNLGIKRARFDYISFLDADDYYLADRFKESKAIFELDPTVDGVYEAVGYHYQNEAAKRRRATSGELTTIQKNIAPEKLFEMQSPIGNAGYCPTGGWVVKRSVFNKTGLFDEHLRLHQDTAMYVKFAAKGKMVPGRLEEAVAMRRMHEHNRISISRDDLDIYKNRVLMFGTLWRWGKKELDRDKKNLLLKKFVDYAAIPYKKTRAVRKRWLSLKQLILLLTTYPDLYNEIYYWKKYATVI